MNASFWYKTYDQFVMLLLFAAELEFQNVHTTWTCDESTGIKVNNNDMIRLLFLNYCCSHLQSMSP